MAKVLEKRLDTDPKVNEEPIEDIDEIKANNLFYGTAGSNASPAGKNLIMPTGSPATGTQKTGKMVFNEPTKKKIQLTFENVVIKTIPQQRKCCKRKGEPEKSKTILNNVSGTIQPGQFLAIIGASGKYDLAFFGLTPIAIKNVRRK